MRERRAGDGGAVIPPQVTAAVIHGLPAALREAQPTFARTGGLHAAGLFGADGERRAVHEDVGRHNAVDKLVGTLLLAGRLPARRRPAVRERAGELRAGPEGGGRRNPDLAAVGAPRAPPSSWRPRRG